MQHILPLLFGMVSPSVKLSLIICSEEGHKVEDAGLASDRCCIKADVSLCIDEREALVKLNMPIRKNCFFKKKSPGKKAYKEYYSAVIVGIFLKDVYRKTNKKWEPPVGQNRKSICQKRKRSTR